MRCKNCQEMGREHKILLTFHKSFLTILPKGGNMEQALFITIAGMGGVFAFLLLLIGAMKLLAFIVQDSEDLNKIAVAVACARRGK